MQNNLNNPVFNPNDSTTWRWNDPALANTIVSEAEARQIRQIAPQLGGVFTLLHTGDSGILPSLIDHNLNETQQLIARRAAIVVTAQQTYGIPIRNEQQAIDAHRQIDNFFGGFDNNMNLHPRQADLIHKTIDSRFAAREFLKGRNSLDNSLPSEGRRNTRRPLTITEAALVHFFKHIVEDIPYNVAQNRHDYLRVNLQAPLQTNDGTYVFIRHAFEYLVRMYEGIGADNPEILTLLNLLINNTAVTGAIKNAIIREISATKLGASLKHLQGITDEEAVWYINFLSGLVNGIRLQKPNNILDSQQNIITVFDVSKTDINIDNLCHAKTMANDRGALTNLATFIDYIRLVVNLINAGYQAVNAGCLNDLLDFQEGALALNFARSKKIDPNTLAQSLHIAITAPHNPAHSKENQAAYINLMTEAVSKYINGPHGFVEVMVPGFHNQPLAPVDFIRELFNNAAMSILLNRARVIGLNANAIACTLARSRGIEGTLLLLGFVLDIIGVNIQNINVQLINDFVSNQSGATDTLNKARNVHLNASSVARLMSCGNNHNNRLADLRVVIDLIEPQNRAAIRLEADAVNRYLALDGSPEKIHNYRVQNISRDMIIEAINLALRVDAARQVIARLPEDIRNPILAELNQQNAA